MTRGGAGDDLAPLREADRLTERYTAHYRRSEFTEALDLARRQLELLREHLEPRHPRIADTLNDIGLFCQDLGRYDEAVELTATALEMRREVLGAGHPDVAESWNNLARLHWLRGEFDEVLPALTSAVAIWRAIDDESERVALGLHNLARLHHDLGDFVTAEPLYRRSLALRLGMNDRTAIVSTMASLARLLIDAGDLAGAEELLREAHPIARALADDTPHIYPFTIGALATLLSTRGALEEAAALREEEVACARSLGDDRVNLATALVNQAVVLCDRGDFDAAEPLLTRALEIRTATLGAHHPETAPCLAGLAKILDARGDLGGAAALLRDALEHFESGPDVAHPFSIRTRMLLARILDADGDLEGAAIVLEGACRRFELARPRAGHGIERATFVEEPYTHLADVCLRTERPAEAWQAAERSRARVLADLLVQANHRPLTSAEAERERELAAEEAAIETQVEALAIGDQRATERLGVLRTRLLEAQAQRGEFQRELMERYPLAHGRPVDFERLQEVLAPDQAMVGWLEVTDRSGRRRSWGYVVRSRGAVSWVPLPDEAGSDAPRQWRDRLLRDRESALGVDADPGLDALSHSMYRVWIEPLMSGLRDCRAVVVIPSGSMANVPVEALLADDGETLGDRFVVTYAPSATVHAWLDERPPTDAPPGTALLVGDPVFHRDDLAGDGSAPRGRGRGDATPPRSGRLRRLRWSREEVMRSAAVFPETRVLLGPEASERNLRSMATRDELARYDVIHLATHAMIDHERPARSSLVLSQVDLPDPVEQALLGQPVERGFTTAADVLREWRLDARLISLSACESGVGRQVAGEGMVGFVQAFLAAGARSVLVSLWPVDDEATALLISRFHSNLAGVDGAPPSPGPEALQEARRWLRTWEDDHGWRPFAHPYYWASFILFGVAAGPDASRPS